MLSLTKKRRAFLYETNNEQKKHFILTPDNDRLYAFSYHYTVNAYELCKSGIRVNELAAKRCRDMGIMKLVNYYKLMVPYLAEEYELKLA